MHSLSSPIKTPGHFRAGLSPVVGRRKYRQNPRAGRPQIAYHALKGNHTVRVGWDRDEGEEGRRLAFDPTVTLPGERRVTPRLKRQEAFRAPEPWDISDTDVVVNDAELYRLGILYDGDGNEHVHGSGFCLDNITHNEPVYSIRGAKRAKKTHRRRLPQKQEHLQLSVELLSTYLGDDAAIAQFFTPVGDEEPAQLHHGHFGDIDQQQDGLRLRNISAEPLSIIYELAESSTHSLLPTPAEADFPDLISDNEEEGYEEAKQDIPCNGDWAFVLDPDNGAGRLNRDTDADAITDDHEETTDSTSGAWIFLARDDS